MNHFLSKKMKKVKIKRKINDKLSDELRAGNEIEFEQNENYLCINIFCYEDVAYKIMENIRNILLIINLEFSDFKYIKMKHFKISFFIVIFGIFQAILFILY